MVRLDWIRTLNTYNGVYQEKKNILILDWDEMIVYI